LRLLCGGNEPRLLAVCAPKMSIVGVRAVCEAL
jgi:hypothetical protein